ncbi:MAG: glycerate kinase [Bacteroidales bacterium]|nr:glycerate kinase [Bacteroidales bacterium]
MKIIVSPNTFKGSLSAVVATDVIASELREMLNNSEIVTLPIADGGDGTAEILAQILHATEHRCCVHNPLMRPIDASYYVLPDGSTAIIGISSASGIALLQPSELNAMKTTTFGTGELMRCAVESGCRHLIVALGGSATCDGGTGLAQALGVRFYDRQNEEITTPLCGRKLTEIARYEKPKTLDSLKITVLCDAEATMYGPQGAAYVYAPQKGATPAQVKLLDDALRNYAAVLNRSLSDTIEKQRYTGAAGAAAAGLKALFEAELVSGAEWVLSHVGFEQQLIDADLVITGEGCVDSQSIAGKSLGTMLRYTSKYNVPMIVFCGKNELKEPIDGLNVLEITPKEMSLAQAMQCDVATDNLRRAVVECFR